MDTLQVPPTDILINGSKSNKAGAFAATSQRSSGAMTLDDPIAMHLLVETALGDSKAFEVLSYEELEALKKEDELVLKRIERLRRKLALETKVRDAAKSLQRLYERPKTASISSISGNLPNGAIDQETRDRSRRELEESQRKVDDISRELYTTEERSRRVQLRLLRHTAGVLQTTYGNGHRPRLNEFGVPGGRPYSPDSLDYEKGLNDDESRGLGNDGDEIDGFLDQLRFDSKSKGKSENGQKSREAQLAIGKRLEDLNGFVQDIIGQVNPRNAMAGTTPPKMSQESGAIDGTIFEQLNFLSRGLDEIKSEQRTIRMSRQLRSTPPTPTFQKAAQLQSDLETSIQENLALQKQYDDTEERMAQMLEELNLKFVDILSNSSVQQPIPSVPTVEDGPTAQINFARDRLNTMTKVITSHTEAASRSRNASVSNDRTAQYDVVLNGLWQIMLAGEDDVRQRKRDERQQLAAQRAEGADYDSEDDVSPDEDDGLGEEFSLPAFSTKVQFLVSKSTYWKEKQSDLRRRMRQMRAMYEQRDAAGNAGAQAVNGELQRIRENYSTTKEELADVEARLSQSESRAINLERELTKATMQAREESSSLLNELQVKKDAAESRLQQLESELTAATSSREEAQRAVSEAQARAQQATEEARTLESEVVDLKTELTICKADLDAAFGSRQERVAEQAKAAESAAAARLADAEQRNAALAAELETLRSASVNAAADVQGAGERERQLKQELQATLGEFEELTRASVEAEKEREDMEREVDRLREAVEGLEGQLADERINKMGMLKSPGAEGAGAAPQTTSAMMLRNEFKKMMRDTRAEHQKALRAEQEERRKLETQLRNLRKEQGGPTKSLLSRVLKTS